MRTEGEQPGLGNPAPGTSTRVCPVFTGTDLRVYETGRITFALRGPKSGPVVKAELSGALQLADRWHDLAGVLDDPAVLPLVWTALLGRRRAGPPPDGMALDQDLEPGAVRTLRLPGPAARQLAGRGDLRQPYGICLRTDRATLRVRIQLQPAAGDEEAAALFALDLAAARLNTQPALTVEAALAQAAGELGGPSEQLTPEAVRRRMWKLRMYRSVYRLRESEDFRYA